MCPAKIILILLLLLELLNSTRSMAESTKDAPGLFLCASPMAAQQFWDEVVKIQQTGVTVNASIAGQIAPRWNCTRFASNSFLVSGALNGWAVKVTDGIHSGWVVPQYYADYSRRFLLGAGYPK